MPDVLHLLAGEEASSALRITFCGVEFDLPEQENTMALMEFAAAAMDGVDSASLTGLAALHNLLEGSLSAEQWPQFKALARRNRSSGDDLYGVVQDIFRVRAEHPTGRLSDSSDGPASTQERSEEDVFSRARRKLEAKGRPDLAVFVLQAEEHAKTA